MFALTILKIIDVVRMPTMALNFWRNFAISCFMQISEDWPCWLDLLHGAEYHVSGWGEISIDHIWKSSISYKLLTCED